MPPGVILISVLVLASCLSYWAYRRFRRATVQSLANLGNALRAFEAHSVDLRASASEFSRCQQEPYQGLLTQLDSNLRELEKLQREMQRNRRLLLRSLPPISTNLIQDVFKALKQDGRQWFRVQRSVQARWKQISRLQALHDTALAEISELREQGWRVATRLRAVVETERETWRLMAKLSKFGVDGPAFSEQADVLKQLHEAIQSQPTYFLQDSHEAVLRQATTADVEKTWAVLTSIEPEYARLFVLATQWQKEYDLARSAVEDLNVVAVRTVNQWNALPEPIDVSDLEGHMQELVTLAAATQEVFEAPPVSELSQIRERASETRAALAELLDTLIAIERQYHLLTAAITANEKSIFELAKQLNYICRVPMHPLALESSGNEIRQIHAVAQDIGDAVKSRTPEQIKYDWMRAGQLETRLSTLHSIVQTRLQQRAELIDIWYRDELQNSAAWAAQTENLFQQMSEYSLANWDESIAADRLVADTHAWLHFWKDHVPDSSAVPIPESRLEFELTTARSLVADRQALEQRAAAARLRLAELPRIERETQTLLEATQQALQKALTLIAADSFLLNMAGQKLTDLGEEMPLLRASLADRAQGTVAQKAAVVQVWNNRCDLQIVAVIKEISGEVNFYEKDLVETLNTLEKIAPLAQQPVVKRAETLRPMQTFAADFKVQLAIPKTTTDHATELQTLLERRLALRDTVEHLKSEVSGPILEPYEDMAKFESHARQELDKARKIIPDQRAWPPCSATLDEVKQKLNDAKTRRDHLKHNGATTVHVGAELRFIAEMYRSCAELASGAARLAGHDQRNIKAQLEILKVLRKKWRVVHNYLAANNIPTTHVDDLRNEISVEAVEKIKRDYLSGLWDYERVDRQLQYLVTRSAKPIEQNQSINIHGDIVNHSGYISISQLISAYEHSGI
jgi:hypothetical protein